MRFQKQLPDNKTNRSRAWISDGVRGRGRMSRHMAPVMLGLTAFPLAAIGIAAFLVVSAGPQMMAVAGAILLLSCCILVAATVVAVKLSRHEEWLWAQQDSLRGLAGKTDAALARIAALETRDPDEVPVAQVEALAVDESRTHRGLDEDLARASRRQPAASKSADVRECCENKPAVLNTFFTH